MARERTDGGWAQEASRRSDRDDGEADGPLRLCAVSRAELPPDELIRFVAGPDGAIVPDLARRLPGRGVWVDGHGSRRQRPSTAGASPGA